MAYLYFEYNEYKRKINSPYYLHLRSLHMETVSRTFQSACMHGDLKFIKRMCSDFPLHEIVRTEENLALRLACYHNQLHVAEWLYSTFNLCAEDARACENEIFREACSRGNMKILLWLYFVVGLCRSDALALNSEGFRSACKNGHLEVTKWFAETFNIKEEPQDTIPEVTLEEIELDTCKFISSYNYLQHEIQKMFVIPKYISQK